MDRRGLVHIYTGNGKGKTTACAGLALRMAGSGGKVLYSFMQKGFKSSEIKMLESVENVDVFQVCRIKKFMPFLNDDEKKEYIKQHREGIGKLTLLASQGIYDMVVIDEAVGAVNEKVLETEDIIGLIKKRSPGCEIVISGRNASAQLIEAADYVSEIQLVKHPYDKGIKARKGIEY